MLSKNDIKSIIQESKISVENTANLIYSKLDEFISEDMAKAISRLCYFCENTEDLKNQNIYINLRLYTIERKLQKEFPNAKISFTVIKDAIDKIVKEMNNQGYTVITSDDHAGFIILKIYNWYPKEL